MDDAIYEGEWTIAVTSSGKYLGKVIEHGLNFIRMNPVYCIKELSMMHQGQPSVDVQLLPFLLIACDIELMIRGDAALLELRLLEKPEQARWHDLIRNVRRGMTQIRAQRVGIQVPPTRA